MLYRSQITAQERMQVPMEQMQKSIQDWISWKEKHGDFLVESGSPIGDAKLIGVDGISDGDNNITGKSNARKNTECETTVGF